MGRMMEIHLMVNDKLDQGRKVGEIATKMSSRYGMTIGQAKDQIKEIQEDRKKQGIRN